MPTIVQTFQGRVTGLWGTATRRDSDGTMRPLGIGDLVRQGDVILTSQDGIVQLSPDETAAAQAAAAAAGATAAITARAPAENEIDRIISGLDDPNSADATAAGVTGGNGAGDLAPGLRVGRIDEGVTPTGPTPSGNLTDLRAAPVVSGDADVSEAAQDELSPDSIEADSARIDAREEGPTVNLGLDAPTGVTSAAVITVTQLPLIGVLQRADGMPVALGSVLTSAELTGLKYLPPSDYDSGAPVGQFTYTVNDRGVTASGTVAIDLGTVNDAPVGRADSATTPEDTPLSGNVLANDTDVDGNALVVTQYTVAGVAHVAGSATTLLGIGTLMLSANGSYGFIPAADYFGPVPAITYTVSDGTATTGATLTLGVTPVNDAPKATADIATTPINLPVTVNVLANDSDAEGNPLSVTGASPVDPALGIVTVNPNGTITFTPASNVAGAVTINYGIADGQGGTSAATVVVNVGGNAPPTGTDTSRSTPEDTPYTLLTTDFGFNDADAGQTFAQLRIDTPPGAGTLLFNGTAVPAGLLVSASDIAAGKLVFVPASDANGAPYAGFAFSVRDSAGAFDSSPNTLTFNVTPVNDAPVAAADANTTAEDTPLTTTAATGVLANDTDADAGTTLTVTQFTIAGMAGTFVAGTTAAIGSIGTLVVNADGSYAFVPAPNFNGPVPLVTYTASDGTATSTSTLALSVTAVNDAPVAVADAITTAEDTPLTTTAATGVLANDTDADGGTTLTVTQFAIAGMAGNFAAGTTAAIAGVGTLVVNADGSYAFVPAPNFTGPVPLVTYTASDGTATSTSTLALSVTAVNDAPALSLDADRSHNTVTAQAIQGLFNTGQSNSGTALPQGTLDAHYTLVSAPAGSTLTPSTTALPGPWIANDADSTWIGSIGNQPTGVYQYQTSFTLQPGADPASINIGFDLASDNNLRDILVNGVSTGFSSNLQYGQFTAVELHGVTSAFGPGLNTITFVIDNRDNGSPANSGPTGLRIDNIRGDVAVIVPDALDSLGNYATVYVEGTPVAIADADTAARDIDSPILQGAVITLVNPQAGDQLFAGALPFGIVASVNPTGTSVTLSGAASQASYDAAIRAVRFDNTSDTPPSATDRIVTVVVNDGFANSNTATTTIHVVPVGDAPRLDLDADNSTAAGNDRTGTYVENGAGTAIADADIVIQDLDSTQLRSATIRIVDVQSGDLLVAGQLPGGISAAIYDPASGVLTLSGNATLADYQAALRGLVFSNSSDQPAAGARQIEISVSDGVARSNIAVSRITVVPVNDAPVAAPDTAPATEDVLLARSAATGVLTNDTDVDTGDGKTVSAVAYGATAGTVGSALAGIYGTLTLGADGSYTYLADRAAAQALGQGQTATEQFAYTVSDTAGATSTSTLTLTITGTNDAPLASNDTGSVLAASTLAQTAANGVILSNNAATGRDADPDASDALRVAQAGAGTAVPSAAVTAAGTTFTGLYGDLLLRSDGSYSYAANRADAVATGTSVSDVFTYRLSDGQGGTSTATLTIAVAGQADTLAAAAPTTTTLSSPLGLAGEYYGYNDFNPAGANGNRRHADDGSVGNLNSVADFNTLVNLRNAAKGGSAAILGSTTAALSDATDATFVARTLDYGSSPSVNNSLGSNLNLAAGASTAGMTNGNSALFKFLNRSGAGGGDAGSLAIRSGTTDNDAAGTGPTGGLGTTSDAGIRLTGQVYLEAGVYDIRVTADDGYRLKLQNSTVAMFDGIQGPTTRVYSGVGVEGGLTPLELIYWEQGGNAVLKIEYKLTGTANGTYKVMGSDSSALFSELNAPGLADNQHIVAGATPGTWLVQTGSVLDGGAGTDTLTGNTGSDLLRGGAGNDVLSGGAGDDVLIGGKGNDTMNGGAGHDVFRWSLGDAGSAGAPAFDTINGFSNAGYAGDRLDLCDLLVGEDHLFNTVSGGGATAGTNALTINGDAGNLGNYLHFSASNGNTVLEISSTGGFAGGYNSASVDQVITIAGADLTAGFASDNAVIADLFKRGALLTDGH